MSTAHLILVDYPALVLVIPAFMAAALFDNLIDGQMFKTGILGKQFAVASFAYARRTRHDNIRMFPSHGCSMI